MEQDSLSDIVDTVLRNNTRLIDNKYLIFYVKDSGTNEFVGNCYGTIDCCLSAGEECETTVSVSCKSNNV
ncbi:lef-10 [Clostera anastomosis granulovirus A]|uniref:Lef-10 n=1 Tax=Clostera anastomosis granulovirus A TaxID=1986289 RepID=U5KB81_9BBAC|nr:lef-10 [Clostera anastomosis granulovirus Henan]AGQ20376.1 lef-10 [Clostera anastomosis granulovirus Henan]